MAAPAQPTRTFLEVLVDGEACCPHCISKISTRAVEAGFSPQHAPAPGLWVKSVVLQGFIECEALTVSCGEI